MTEEHETACRYILEARNIRKKYNGSSGSEVSVDLDFSATNNPKQQQPKLKFRIGMDGVAEIFKESDIECCDNLVSLPSVDEFVKDYNRIVEMCSDGAMRSFW